MNILFAALLVSASVFAGDPPVTPAKPVAPITAPEPKITGALLFDVDGYVQYIIFIYNDGDIGPYEAAECQATPGCMANLKRLLDEKHVNHYNVTTDKFPEPTAPPKGPDTKTSLTVL